MNEQSSPLDTLQPRLLWQSFDAIRRVPRPSKHEERIAALVDGWAAEHGFEVRTDTTGNRVVVVPARPGCEAAPTVVLQAHLDMVCEKNAGTDHDFDRDPIDVVVDGDWVRARGTTLGADNGIGVAAAMAAAVDPQLVCGPLELLFTLDEETGLNGAGALDPAIVTGRLLVNLDTEEEGAVYIGCAGAAGIEARLDLRREARDGQRWRLVVDGLRGGHSGIDIDSHRGNAVKIAARVLQAARDAGIDFGLVSLDGGDKANAIPREAAAELVLTADEPSGIETVLRGETAQIASELGEADPGLRIVLEASSTEGGADPLAPADRDRLIALVAAAHHGVLAMSLEVPGLVETSNNVASVATEAEVARVALSIRSSVNAALAGTLQSLTAMARLAGAKVEVFRGYPGWQPKPDAALVRRTVEVHERTVGHAPEIKAVHAGLECGILAEKVPGLEAVSIGPVITGAHSPDEKVNVPSTARFYDFLVALLGDLATRPIA